MGKLKPCPFCNETRQEYLVPIKANYMSGDKPFAVICLSCMANGSYARNIKSAIATWNTRAERRER